MRKSQVLWIPDGRTEQLVDAQFEIGRTKGQDHITITVGTASMIITLRQLGALVRYFELSANGDEYPKSDDIVEVQLTYLEDKVKSLMINVADHEQQRGQMSEDVQNLQMQVGKHENKINSLTRFVDKHDLILSGLRRHITNLQDNQAISKSTIRTIENKIQDIWNQLRIENQAQNADAAGFAVVMREIGRINNKIEELLHVNR